MFRTASCIIIFLNGSSKRSPAKSISNNRNNHKRPTGVRVVVVDHVFYSPIANIFYFTTKCQEHKCGNSNVSQKMSSVTRYTVSPELYPYSVHETGTNQPAAHYNITVVIFVSADCQKIRGEIFPILYLRALYIQQVDQPRHSGQVAYGYSVTVCLRIIFATR